MDFNRLTELFQFWRPWMDVVPFWIQLAACALMVFLCFALTYRFAYPEPEYEDKTSSRIQTLGTLATFVFFTLLLLALVISGWLT